MTTFNIVLAGNPNCGKTALFNVLTGSHQRVGNWPGVTVEQKLGSFIFGDYRIGVVDLPGVYSLSANSEKASLDEKIACEYLLAGKIDLIVNVVDASNLERNLYLTTQLLEMGLPVILAVNMTDVAEQHGLKIDLKGLSESLHCPVVPTVATRHRGLEALKRKMVEQFEAGKKAVSPTLPFPSVLQSAISHMESVISQSLLPHASLNHRWLAIKLLEGNLVLASDAKDQLMNEAKNQINRIEKTLGEETDILIADARYGFIHQLVHQFVQKIPAKQTAIVKWIDKIVLDRILGLPIFFGIMYCLFYFAIDIAGAFQDFFNIAGDTIFVHGLSRLLLYGHIPDWLIAILANGAGKGLSTTITFIPVIGGMFLFLSFLEDSGYMARAAFLMDRFMRAVGLPGKSFLPMVMGFGCNVPAVLSARTLSNRRDRILTIMMLPFMSCGARMAIFAVFASAFFPHDGQNMIFILYLIGILVAILTGLLLRKTVLKGETEPLVMELPAYHIPHLNSLLKLTWHRLKSFVYRAGKVILPFCMVLGLLNALTFSGNLVQEGAGQNSILSAIGRTITPIFSPMGIHQNNWPATVGLMSGVVAKEVVVGTLNTLYGQQANISAKKQSSLSLMTGFKEAVLSVPINLRALVTGEENASDEAMFQKAHAVYGLMSNEFDGKVGAFSYLLFVLLYFPCIATIAVMRRELNKKWAWFSMFWTTGLAYLLATLCYQALTIIYHPVTSVVWVIGIVCVLIITAIALSRYANQKTE
ncbi:MAG: ferrous iron transport protein B [Gammaproteobacteria bacterium RIFOXYB2_FULL_38_6]|nr:MAG: ferrous iron transport protein B [Gammaproteobacteria bacterium RIFOXYB2_FULL_38_6]